VLKLISAGKLFHTLITLISDPDYKINFKKLFNPRLLGPPQNKILAAPLSSSDGIEMVTNLCCGTCRRRRTDSVGEPYHHEGSDAWRARQHAAVLLRLNSVRRDLLRRVPHDTMHRVRSLLRVDVSVFRHQRRPARHHAPVRRIHRRRGSKLSKCLFESDVS